MTWNARQVHLITIYYESLTMRTMHARLLRPLKARFTMYAKLLTHYVCKAVDILESPVNARTQSVNPN